MGSPQRRIYGVRLDDFCKDNNQNLTETFSYDDLNRLTQSAVTNPAGDGPMLGFSYDAVGDVQGCTSAAGGRTPGAANIQSKTLNGVIETYTYAPNHPYAVSAVSSGGSQIYSASYDPDGNMLTRNGDPIQWTPSNLPSSISGSLGSSTFNYGPGHQRYYQAATLNGVITDTTYIGGLFEVVANTTNGTEYRHNIFADGQVIAVHTIDSNGTANASGNASTAYLHYDQLGSVNAITNDSGTVIQQMSFSAYGQRRIASNWNYGVSQDTLATLKDYTDRGYTDQEQLDNLSLVDLNGRVYDPTVGRFISADPTGGSGLGRYTYVGDSPLDGTDPTGFATTGMPCKGQTSSDKCKVDGGPSPAIPILPVGVHAWRPIGDNTDEPGATNLSNCNCVVNGPSRRPSNEGSTGATSGSSNNQNNNSQQPINAKQPMESQPQNRKTNDCGSSQGIPRGEALLAAVPSAQILTTGEHSVVVTGNGSQVQVALTNDSLVPAIAVTEVSFHVGNMNFGDFGADILSHTTSTFRSETFGVLGAPLSMRVNIDIENDGVVETARFCVVGANGG